MKLLTKDGVVILALESGLQIELHGENESVSLTCGNQTLDIGVNSDKEAPIMIDGWNFRHLVMQSVTSAPEWKNLQHPTESTPLPDIS